LYHTYKVFKTLQVKLYSKTCKVLKTL